MGRTPMPINMEQLEGIMRFKPTCGDCAAFFKCSEDTIERRIREYSKSEEFPEGLSFADFREQHLVHTRHDLVQMALSRASSSDTMLIFCLKVLCGWRDRSPGEDNPLAIINNYANKSDEDLNLRIKELTARGD